MLQRWAAGFISAAVMLAGNARADQTIGFFPSDAVLLNPERGFWRSATGNLLGLDGQDLADMRTNGISLIYSVARLDPYRNGPLPAQALAQIAAGFAAARAAGVKVIVRFAYNYPENSSEYDGVQDAPLSVVLGHIAQLGPLLAENADTIAVMQAGFIGAWGEQHTSSNGLDSDAAKAVIKAALLAAVPAPIQIQWRYPSDIMHWPDDPRIGFHNDCFLSSDTDVGTYDTDPVIRAAQKAAMAIKTDTTFYSGETCDAQQDLIRTACADVFAEAALLHLSSLNLDYNTDFHHAWAKQGCYAEIEARMGYRLRLLDARRNGDRITVRLINDGWARPLQARALRIGAPDGAQAAMGPLNLSDVAAGQTVALQATISGKMPNRLCLTAPDSSPRLATDPRFAIRFANADGAGMAWNAETAAYCFDTPVQP